MPRAARSPTASTTRTSIPTTPVRNPNSFGGIFNFDNPLNPLRDYSFVVVPYCTGDGHLGNAVTDYGDGMVVRHNGFVNANTALAEAVDRFGRGHRGSSRRDQRRLGRGAAVRRAGRRRLR